MLGRRAADRRPMDTRTATPDPDSDHSVLGALERRAGAALRVQLNSPEQDATPVVVAAASGDAPVGRLISQRYQLQGEIARGGVGVVYKARDVDLGRDVALKLLHDRFRDHSEILQRFIEEAQVGGQLQHPGIVPVYEIGLCEDGRPFIAMKLIKGGTLAELLERRSDSKTELHRILTMFSQVCQTVAYAHSRRVVHRDIKPSNIMVGAFGEVQIVDWGFAKVLRAGGIDDEERSVKAHLDSLIETSRSKDVGSESQVGSAIGTPAYMPPEQARGDVEDMDARSDVFALGAMLCEILTGAPPYVKGEGREVLLVQAAQCQLDDANARLQHCGHDSALVQLAQQCLSPRSAARPRDAAAVAAGIDDYLAGVDDRVRRAEVAAASARVRSRFIAALAASVLLTAVVAAGGWVYLKSDRAARRRADERRYAAQVQQVERLRATAESSAASPPGLWDKVLYHARQAATLAAELPDAEPGATTVAAWIDDLEQRRDLAAEHQRERQLLDDLIEMRIPRDQDVRGDRWAAQRLEILDEGYARVFRNHGVDVEAAPPAEVASRLRGGADVELAAALDHWAMVRRTRSRSRSAGVTELTAAAEGGLQDWRHLQRVARALDANDNWRNDLRDYLASPAPDPMTAQALRESAVLSELPAVSAVLLASTLAAIGDHTGVTDVLKAAQRLHPRDFDLAFHLGLQLERTQPPRWAEAARYYTAAFTLRPGLAVLALRLAFVTAKLGEREEAIAWYKRAIEINPELADAYPHLGAALVAAGKPDEALRYAQRGIRIAPEHHLTRWGMGNVLAQRGETDRAINELRYAIRIQPKFVRGHVELGGLLHDKGAADDAVQVLVQATELDAGNVDAQMLLSTVVERVLIRGDMETAASRGATERPRRRTGRTAPAPASDAGGQTSADSARLQDRDNGRYRPRPRRLADRAFRVEAFAAAARLYSAATRAEGADPTVLLRSAVAGARAGCGEGIDAVRTSSRDRQRFLRHAREQLESELCTSPPPNVATLLSWQNDPGLECVRNENALEMLPAADAAGWRLLWSTIAARCKGR